MKDQQRIEQLEAEVDWLTTENLVLKAKLEEAQVTLEARRVWDAGVHEN